MCRVGRCFPDGVDRTATLSGAALEQHKNAAFERHFVRIDHDGKRERANVLDVLVDKEKGCGTPYLARHSIFFFAICCLERNSSRCAEALLQ